jgi:hypothetical protein
MKYNLPLYYGAINVKIPEGPFLRDALFSGCAPDDFRGARYDNQTDKESCK